MVDGTLCAMIIPQFLLGLNPTFFHLFFLPHSKDCVIDFSKSRPPGLPSRSGKESGHGFEGRRPFTTFPYKFRPFFYRPYLRSPAVFFPPVPFEFRQYVSTPVFGGCRLNDSNTIPHRPSKILSFLQGLPSSSRLRTL